MVLFFGFCAIILMCFFLGGEKMSLWISEEARCLIDFKHQLFKEKVSNSLEKIDLLNTLLDGSVFSKAYWDAKKNLPKEEDLNVWQKKYRDVLFDLENDLFRMIDNLEMQRGLEDFFIGDENVYENVFKCYSFVQRVILNLLDDDVSLENLLFYANVIHEMKAYLICVSFKAPLSFDVSDVAIDVANLNLVGSYSSIMDILDEALLKTWSYDKFNRVLRVFVAFERYNYFSQQLINLEDEKLKSWPYDIVMHSDDNIRLFSKDELLMLKKELLDRAILNDDYDVQNKQLSLVCKINDYVGR